MATTDDNHVPSDAAMRVARECAYEACRYFDELYLASAQQRAEGRGFDSSGTDPQALAARMLKHLPVSEQGRDRLTDLEVEEVEEILEGHNPVFVRRVIEALKSATTPPPASDEQCVKCGHNTVNSNGECRQCIDWQKHICEFPANKIPSPMMPLDTIWAPKKKLDDPAPSVPAGEKDDGWVMFGTIKTDIENETQTFERVSPEPAPSSGDAAHELVVEWAKEFGVPEYAITDTSLEQRINALITTEREATRTAIVGLVRRQAGRWLARLPNSDDATFKYHYQTRADAATELADLIERTSLDELMKGGE